MKLCRVTHKTFESPRYAYVEDGRVWLINEGEQFDPNHLQQNATSLTVEEVKLLAPVVPSKIVCVGRNFREHAAELGHDVPVEPLIFLKPPSALLAPGGQIE